VKTLFPWCGIGLNAQFAKSPDIVMESFHSSYERGCRAKRSPLPIRSLVPTLDISIQACTKLAAIQRGAVRCGLFRHYLRQQYDVIDSGLLRHTRVGCGHRTRYAQRGQPRPRSGRRSPRSLIELRGDPILVVVGASWVGFLSVAVSVGITDRSGSSSPLALTAASGLLYNKVRSGWIVAPSLASR
jgi:hypothetical protein